MQIIANDSMSQSFIINQPPLIVFTVCLTIFGFTMIVLAHLVGEQEVPNPDVQMDWNNFFKKMSSLKLCPLQNFTNHINEGIASDVVLHPRSSLNSSASHVVDESKSMSAVLSNVVDSAMDENWHEAIFVEVSVKVKFGLQGKMPMGALFNVKGTIKGNLLGLPGKYAQLLFNVSLCFRTLTINNSCHGNECSSLYDVCITISLPSDILPKTKAPEVCKIKYYPLQQDLPVMFSEIPIMDVNDSSTSCIELNYTPDAKLTEMLSPHDRSIVNLHLMHTSYFMFVMVMTLICFSLVRGRFRQPKNYHSLQKVPLDA